jgi:DNA invertase Pin-like site-specific DNA recombinase
MPCYFYVRESHADSWEKGNSHKSQEDECQRYYEYRIAPLGIPKGERVFYDPKTSARHIPFLQRPAGKDLDRILQAGDHVVFSHLDRGYRAVMDFSVLMERWKERGVIVHFASLGVDLSTPAGMLVANIMASVAQGESDLKSERNREIAAFRRKMGRPTSPRRRVGCKVVGKKGDRYYAPFKEEREILEEIIKLHEQGWTWKQVGILIEARARSVRFPATRVTHRATLMDHYPVGFWAGEACRKKVRQYLRTVAHEQAVLARANHADTPAPSA